MASLSLGIPPTPAPMRDVVRVSKHSAIHPSRNLANTPSIDNNQMVRQPLMPEFMDIFTIL